MPNAVEIRKEVGELREQISVANLKVGSSVDGVKDIKGAANEWLSNYVKAVCEHLAARAILAWATYGLTSESGELKYRFDYEAQGIVDFTKVNNEQIAAVAQEHLDTLWVLGSIEVKVLNVGPDEMTEIVVLFESDD